MITVGAHMSIAGGYYKAVEAAAEVGCDCVQLFTKNNNQWRAKPISDDDVDRFRGALKRLGIGAPLSHASYLINLATPDRTLWDKSIESTIVELQRASRLGIPYVVLHPGAYTTSSETRGIRKIAWALDRIHHRLPDCDSQILLENTAGQGSTLGWKFSQLARIIELTREPERLGVCIDTCHAFAAGYQWSGKKQFTATLKELKSTVGLERIKALHLNDSVKPLGSRVDRHAHIGHGEIGLDGFQFIVRSRLLRKIPMYLETPKTTDPKTGKPWDVINLQTIRELASLS